MIALPELDCIKNLDLGASAESVGELGFRQSTNCWIQSDFSIMKGPKTEGFSRGQLRLGVEILCSAANANKQALGPEPVEQQAAGFAQHRLIDLGLQRLDLTGAQLIKRLA